jgi:hypothetical protein
MFDSLRNISDDDDTWMREPEEELEEFEPAAPAPRILGMTAGQRLVISILLFFTVIVLGAACLVVTEKVWLVP